MTGEVQRFPRGLLEVLGAKSGGVVPSTLAQQIVCGVDVLQLYALSQERYIAAENAVAAEGDGVTFTVPDTEFWILHDLSLHWVKTATATYMQGSLWQRKGTIGPFVGLASGPTAVSYPFGSTPAATSLVAHFNPTTPRILTPGTVLYGTVDILGTDATADIKLRARVGVLD